MGQPTYRILSLLIVGILTIGYVYIAYPLSFEATKNAVNDLVEVGGDRRRLMRFSQLPSNTIQVLLAHDSNADTLTDEETEILLQAFNLYDVNGDDMWSVPEFEVFIEDTIEPSKRFDVMDLDGNGVLSLKEIYLTMSAFDSTNIFACADSDQVLLDVFGYDTSPRDNLYYEYLAHLWMYELDQLGMDVISKANYVKYIQDEEAFYHGYDESSVVGFDVFKNAFFDSLYFESWRDSMYIEPGLISDAYAELQSFDDAGIAALELTTQHGSVNPTIEAYMDGRIFSAATGHSPTRSLLYAFPLNDVFTRRRLNDGSAITLNIDPSYLWTTDGRMFEKWWKTCRDVCKSEVKQVGTFAVCECMPANNNWRDPYSGDAAYSEECSAALTMGKYMAAIDMETGLLVKEEGVGSPTCEGCFAGDGVVDILANGVVQEMQFKDLTAGDYVFDGTEYSKVIAVEQREEKVQMMKVHLNDNTEITMTAHHLLYNGQSELIQAGNLKIGDKLLNDLVVVDVEFGLYESPLNALTMSGKIQVNGVSASCYVFSAEFAAATHRILAPFRFLSEYVSEYYTAKVVEATVFGTARAINLGGQVGASLGLPAFINVFIIILLMPVLFAKQFFVFCFSQYSVMEFGHLMSQYFSL